MDDLIKALMIFRKYNYEYNPTCCGHDVFYVNVDPQDVCEEDTEELSTLSFIPDYEFEPVFKSYRFGSC